MAEPAKAISLAKKTSAATPLRLVPASDLLDRIGKMYDQIARRAFEIFESNGQIFGRDLEDWFKAESELLHPVHVDITESAKDLSVRAEVPGFAANELEISMEGNQLTIAGKRESRKERREKKSVYAEHCSDQLLRVVSLPVAVDAAKAQATLKDGVLELTLPKAAPAKKIAIEAKAS